MVVFGVELTQCCGVCGRTTRRCALWNDPRQCFLAYVKASSKELWTVVKVGATRVVPRLALRRYARATP